MIDTNQNPDQEKAREYDEIQQRATETGRLEGIHTHESHNAKEVMENAKKGSTPGDADNATPGLGRGVEGTGVM